MLLRATLALGLVSGVHSSLAKSLLDPKSLVHHPGIEISLWAAEPDVVDPVALCFDALGKAYVIEMRDYPYGFGPDRKPGGTIRTLEDTDGDGVADKSIVFAENLSFPTSITPWRGGVLVTAPPQILYLRDSDADGKADVRQVVLEGFELGVTDSNVNGLRFGPDSRIHGINAGNGGVLTSPRRPDVKTTLGDLDFSFHPDTGEVETTYHTGGGFGLVFDAWGNSFTTHNINHIQQRMMKQSATRRSPGFPPVALTLSISDHGDMAVIHPVSAPTTRPNHPEQSGHFSSAGGMGYIGHFGWPGDLAGSVLVCDVVGNLVHRDILVGEGPQLVAARATNELESEFIASRDPAFRPIALEMGPDGALYLADMQRDVIEHPDYIPDKMKATLNLRAGEDRGRIYRITPKGGMKPARTRLGQANSTALVEALEHPSQWWRTTAQRLLVERKATDAGPALRRMARGNTMSVGDIVFQGSVVGGSVDMKNASGAMGRLHALWTLHGLGQMDDADLRSGLIDTEPRLRAAAARLAYHRIFDSATLKQPLLDLTFDANPMVRFETALALGQLKGREPASGLYQILRTGYENPWLRRAAWASLGTESTALIHQWTEDRNWREGRGTRRLEAWREFATFVGARGNEFPGDVSLLLSRFPTLAEHPCRVIVAEGLQDGLARSGSRPPLNNEASSGIRMVLESTSPGALRAGMLLTRHFNLPLPASLQKRLNEALSEAADPQRRENDRLERIQLLGFTEAAAGTPVLMTLLGGVESPAIQAAALSSLKALRSDDLGVRLVDQWRNIGAAARPAALNLLLDRRPFHEPLIRALEEGRIQVGELNLDLEQRRRLLRGGSKEIQARAAKFISDEEYSNRKSMVNEWMAKLPPTGNAARGREIFTQACSGCHVAEGAGQRVGPDLSAVSHRSAEDLLSNILDPNMAIHPEYVAYVAETTSGDLETGILQPGSSDAVSLLQAAGKRVTVARADLKRLTSTGQSLMPEGLEANRTPQEMRDLIEFLQTAGKPPVRK